MDGLCQAGVMTPSKKFRENIYHRIGIKDPGQEQTAVMSQDKEIQMFRKVIRDSRLFEDPYSNSALKSITGEILHPDLVNFYNTCQKNFENYVSNKKDELLPVFVKMEDEVQYNDINNWTINKISQEIQQSITSLPDEELGLIYQDMFRTDIVKSNKAGDIQFLQELRGLHQMMQAEELPDEFPFVNL